MYGIVFNAQRNRCSLCFKTYNTYLFDFPEVIRICFNCANVKFITTSEIRRRYGNIDLLSNDLSKKRKRTKGDEKKNNFIILTIKRYHSRTTYFDEDVSKYLLWNYSCENNQKKYEMYNTIYFANRCSAGFRQWQKEAKIRFKYLQKRKDIEFEEIISLCELENI